MKSSLHNIAFRIRFFLLRNKIKTIIALVLLIGYYFALPKKIFDTPYTTVIESKEGRLLAAKIAADGQWRFPMQDTVPYKFEQCLLYFEDEYFYYHWGFNPVSVYHAIRQNINAGKNVRGGSTLTQQVIRISRKNKKRSYGEKFWELILATRLEFRHSKRDIINLYAAHAPFGGNVVGLEMASWRYFGVSPAQLSWAEAATLAVLPNAPALIYPGKNQIELIQKRNRLLKKLYTEKIIDQATYQLAIIEPAPDKPYPLPNDAPHLLLHLAKTNEGQRIRTTVDYALQNRLNQLATYYHNHYRQSEINNLAILVVDVATRNIIGYVGNSPTDVYHQKDVDIITAPRSTGSILKPLLYGAMLDDGMLLPNTLIPDIPTQIGGYSPMNFKQTFDGAVPASMALSRSLNIPAVLMLQRYGVNRFHHLLQQYQIRHINQPAEHYGLSLILGGAEASLWDMCKTYANLSGTLNYFTSHQSLYRELEFSDLNVDAKSKINFGKNKKEKNWISAAAIWHTFNAMKNANRPEEDEAWEFYDSSIELAWKTGTSFGNRDAWAIGTNPRYVVGVWVGNASGEGRPSLTGVGSAAPILFDVFRALPRGGWFATPFSELQSVAICAQSGMLANENCPTVSAQLSLNYNKTAQCPYHRLIFLDSTLQYRVSSECEQVCNMKQKSWFVLPPVMEWYYKPNHIDYQPLPPYRDDCKTTLSNAMDFIYPKENERIVLAKSFDEKLQPMVIKVAHSNKKAVLFWYVDDSYIGTTAIFHEKEINCPTGSHRITVVDELGNEISRKIEVVRE